MFQRAYRPGASVTAGCAAPPGDEQPSDDESTEVPTADQEKAARDDESHAKTASKSPPVVQSTLAPRTGTDER